MWLMVHPHPHPHPHSTSADGRRSGGRLPTHEVAKEQEYVAMLYSNLDQERQHAGDEIVALLRESAGQARDQLERDARITHLRDREAALDAAEHGLCFGRIDRQDGQRYYIGRIGLRDRNSAGDALLLDWRAPAARPFYLATAASPEGLRRRRHLTTRRRRVVRVDDELLTGEGAVGDERLVGEGALMAALTAGRSGRMKDVVATLQREQDEAVRSTHSGVLVVQGGPGTGKTAVALHRAAYLLYNHPEIARRGVLVVGPSPHFLAYVSDVLPGLGETRAVLSTVAELFPGVRADRVESPQIAQVKGKLEMAEVIAAAVRARQSSDEPVTLEVDGDLLTLSVEFLHQAREHARAGRLAHNLARVGFHRRVVHELARLAALAADRRMAEVEEGFEAEIAAADRALTGELDSLPATIDEAAALSHDAADTAQLVRELAVHPRVQALLGRLWPNLTPMRLLDDLFADPQGLPAIGGLTDAEVALLTRAPGQGWTEADVPLLDEAAALLGEDARARRRRADREEAEQIAYAQGVLDITGNDEDDENIPVAQMMSARALAARHRPDDARTLAERAAADLTWAYGHVVVDEAQELSAMAWRALIRRCPSGSMTVVGDLAQTHNPAGAVSWPEVLAPHVGDRLRLLRLNVNYRTPVEIMRVAARVLARTGSGESPPTSVRHGGHEPWRAEVQASHLAEAAASWAQREFERPSDERAAILVPEPALDEVRRAVLAQVPTASAGAQVDLQQRVVVLTVAQAKGLEFDSVLVVDPAAVLTGRRGLNDLYVATTRATREIGFLCPDPVPVELEDVVLRPLFLSLQVSGDD
jgi:DNA helicase IV